MTKLKAPVMLVIMDGFGLGDPQDSTNAVAQAKPRNFTVLKEVYPYTELTASGLAVGLPEGQMGNSEVGHLNLGAGRVVYQDLTRISKDIEDGTYFDRPVIKELYARGKKTRLQLVTLLSDGGVHSHIDHVKATIRGAKKAGVTELYVHALLDGRDVPPSSGAGYVRDLEAFMAEVGLGRIATIGGRYYGMDRDNRWERTEKAYRAMVDGEGVSALSPVEAVEASYAAGKTDEFMEPVVLESEGCIKDGDAVFFCNFRPDRARQLTRAFTDTDFHGFIRAKGLLQLYFATMSPYAEELAAHTHIVYEKEALRNTLGEVLAKGGYEQLRIAETEKYAHVTYFFNGGEETPFDGEDRILVPSPKVATYDLQPEMSALEVTEKVLEAIQRNKYDMIILNYANPDMVGHTGDLAAAEKAVTTVDDCVGRLVKEIIKFNGHMLLTADHGNAEIMVNHKTGIPHTAHTTNPVPLILISEQYRNARLRSGGRLCDIAPTMLDLAGIAKPAEMTGESLLER